MSNISARCNPDMIIGDALIINNENSLLKKK